MFKVCYMLNFQVLTAFKSYFHHWNTDILYLFCIQAEVIQQGTMYLSPDVGSRAPLGLAWGLRPGKQGRKSLVTFLLAYSRGKQATGEQLCVDVAKLPPAFNFQLL